MKIKQCPDITFCKNHWSKPWPTLYFVQTSTWTLSIMFSWALLHCGRAHFHSQAEFLARVC